MSFEDWQKENASTGFKDWQNQNTAMLLSEEDAPLASTYGGLDPDTTQRKADNVYSMSQKYELPFSEIERLNAEADAVNMHEFLNTPAPVHVGVYGGFPVKEARTEEGTIEYNYLRLPDNPRMKIMADRYISQRKAKKLAREASVVEVADVLDFNAYLAYFAGGTESAEALMRANLFRNKPKVAELMDDDTTGYLRDNPEQSFIPSIFNTKLDGARADEIDNLVAMTDREAREDYYKAKGTVSTSEFFEEKDKREYMLFADALKAMKNSELRSAIRRIQDPEGSYQKSNLTEHGFSVNLDRDMLLVRDHYFAMEETEARGVDVFPMLADMGLNVVKYMGEIALLAGLGGAKAGRVTFKGLRRAGVPKILSRNVAKLSSATAMAALNPTMTANLTVERMTDKGFIDDYGAFIKTDEGQSIAKALPKSFTEAAVTYFIEQKGEDLVKGLFSVGGKAISKLPRSLVSQLDEVADFMKKTGIRSFDKLPKKLKGSLRAIKDFIAKGKPILRAGKFSGLFGENLEEYADKIVKTGLLLDDQYRDKDDAFVLRVAKSFIPDPTEVLYQSIIFTIMPYAAGAIANAPRAVNWAGKKVKAVAEGQPDLPEVYNRVQFENGVRSEYGFDRAQSEIVADMFEANESIENIEKKVRTFEGLEGFSFDEHNNQKALSEMLIDRGLVVEEANRIAELTAREAIKRDIAIEDVIDTPNFRNQVKSAEKAPEPEPTPAVPEAEIEPLAAPGVEITRPEPSVEPEIEAKPIAEKEVTAEKDLAEPVTELKAPKNQAEARDRSATEWARGIADTLEPGQEIYVPPQVNQLFTFRGKEKATLIQTGDFLRLAGLIPGTELNKWQKPVAPAAVTAKPVEKKPPTKKTIAQANTSQEVDEAIPKLTSARQADIAADREALGLDEIPSPERKTWQTSLQNAKDAGLDDLTEARRLANHVIAKPVALNDETTAGLVLAATKLKNQYRDVIRQINTSTDEAEIDMLSAKSANIEAEFDIITKALHQSGTEKGRALAAQKLTIDRGFDLISVKSRARAIKGKPLSEKENKKFEELSAELESQTEKVSELQRKLSEMETNQLIKKRRHIITGRTRAAINVDIQTLGLKVKSLLEAGCN